MENDRQKMNRKLVSATVLTPLLFLLSILVLFTPTIPRVDPETGKMSFIPLIRPPLSVVQAMPDAPALDTSSIALFGWMNFTAEYGTITDWDIYDSVGVMLNYTDHTDAIDGFIRVWDYGSEYNCTNINPDDDNCYVDVAVRVRSDTVLMAYVNQSQTDSQLERGTAYVWWNHTLCNRATGTSSCGSTAPADPGNPPIYGLSMGRAMEIVVEDGLSATWSGGESGTLNYTRVNYYDYEFTSSDKLFVFGDTVTDQGAGTDYNYHYFTVEGGSTIDNAVIVYGVHSYTGISQTTNATLIIDSDEITYLYQLAGAQAVHASWGWRGFIITGNITAGVQSTITLRNYIANNVYISTNVATLIWSH